MRKWWAVPAAGVVLSAGACLLARGSEGSMDKAEAFLAKLTEAQKAAALLPFEGEGRTTWNYVPMVRAGVAMKDLGPAAKEAGLELLRSSLSDAGYAKADSIRTKLEPTLGEMEKNPGRDPGLYYFAFFGKPSRTGSWGWRFEGHHVSLNFTYHEGKLVSTTPQFLGTNPAVVPAGPYKGLKVLGKEEDMARELVKSLRPEQRKLAILEERAPADLITSNQRKVSILEDKGLPFEAMDAAQKKLLRDLVEVYANVQKPEAAAARLKKVQATGWKKLKFAWMGGIEPGQGHYYRIQGPTFLIEYDNTQNGANHVHSVWRDFEGDFGKDVLEEHYEEAHHRR